jgi:hypothetical protein
MRTKLLLVTTTSHGAGPVPLLLMDHVKEMFSTRGTPIRIGFLPMGKLPCPRVGGGCFAACDMPAGGGYVHIKQLKHLKVNHDPRKYCVVCVVFPQATQAELC